MSISKLFLVCIFCFSTHFTLAQDKQTIMQFDYEKAWKEVDAFQSQGLPESALKLVNEIYNHAKQTNHAGQFVKAVIHKLKFTDAKEDDAFVKNLHYLQDEIKSTQFPVKPVLHSLLAEMYWQYYNQNRWRFYERSETINRDSDDIETWSLAKIVTETQKHYSLSLADADQSKIIPIDLYIDVIHPGNDKGRAYRATLYDFLAHRALLFFMGEEPEIIRPAKVFSINSKEYFADAEKFSTLKIEASDSVSMKFQALTILQSLTRFHLTDKDPSALIEIELSRLHFVRNQYPFPDKNTLYLNALDHLEERVKTNPSSTLVNHQQALVYVEMGGLYDPLKSDAYKWDVKKAHEITTKARQRFPDSDGAILCEQLQYSIEAKSISATIESTNVPAADFRSLIQYKNFSTLYYRIIKTNRKEVEEQRRLNPSTSHDSGEEGFIQYFLKKEAVKNGKYNLPNDNDYQQHSIEIKLDALPEGEYMILYSHKPDFATKENGLAFTFTVISNIAYLHRTSPDGATEFQVLHRQTGAPLSNVKANVYTSHYNYQNRRYETQPVGSYTTDSKGHFSVPYQEKRQSRNLMADFFYKNDFNSTRSIDDQYNTNDGTIYTYKSNEVVQRVQTFFFLDRAIYRPGQTIYFKGIVINTDGKTSAIKNGYKTTIALYDVNHQIKSEIKVTTNEYGTFSGAFTAPSGGLTGDMQIRNLDNTGTAYFSVEEYKRPKFEVTFANVKGSFRLNDVITAKGKAEAYSGASIDGAQVQYRVVRVANFPFWWWCRWGYYPHSPEVEITSGVSRTDASGNFSIDFTAVPDESVDPSSDPVFNYMVYADVTDINGETHSASTSIAVAYKSLKVNVPAHDINKLDTLTASRTLPIYTHNLAGEFEPASGVIKIYLLKNPVKTFRSRLWNQPDRQFYSREEYYKLFPLDLYADENNKFNWEREKEVLTHSFNTAEARSFTLQNIQTWKEGEYVLVITSNDKDGKPVQEISYFTIFSPAANHIAVPQIDYFKPLKLNAEPGEKASFVTGTTGKLHILYEIEQDGKIISKEWQSLHNQQKKTEILIKEEHRGNIGVHYTFVKDSRLYKNDFTIQIPFTNKQLDVTFETFRNKLLPGEQEQWKIKVKGNQAEKIAAEMVATLYDESLDQFRPHSWSAHFYNSFYSRLGWESANGFVAKALLSYTPEWNPSSSRQAERPYYDSFNWFGYNFYFGGYPMKSMMRGAASFKESEGMAEEHEMLESPAPVAADAAFEQSSAPHNQVKKEDLSGIKARTNFNETAFFFPHLRTNEQGEIIIDFTIPEALTRWKMLGFAHTKDLQSGMVVNQVITQKELMVVPNQPRFFREHDKITFTAKITSLSEQPLVGQAQLEFFDAITMKPIAILTKKLDNVRYFSLDAKQSAPVEWDIEIPEGLQAITYRVLAKAASFSDGEEMTVPVVTNRILVTETLPLPIRGKQSKVFKFDKLLSNKSKTLRHQRFSLEFTANPAWYAVQALPYLMEYPYDCVEQIFSRYYANSIASHIANGNPRIKQVFDTWKNIQPDALLSNLEKNPELKSALLEETPWVLQARDETQRKQRLGVLFDLNRMADEQDRALDKIVKAQTVNGGFPWFAGMPEDRYITQHIVAGMGHLDVMGIKGVRSDKETIQMIEKALHFMDESIANDYTRLKELAKQKKIKLAENYISQIHYHYLYARSYFRDIEVKELHREAFQYFLNQAKQYWLESSLYNEGMACLSLHRFGETSITAKMIKSFSERALHSEELGMYWKTTTGYYWYQAPVETQALMIEVFDEVANDTKAVEALKVWLLKQKQTQDWKTTKATAEACYALLRRGSDILTNTNQPEIKIGNEVLNLSQREETKIESGTGYFKTSWSAAEINSSMGNIQVTKTDEGVAWGAAYWQYFEQLDKITPAETPLKIKKELFVQQHTARGPVITPITDQELKVGDLLKVRIELRTDRPMEYVHLKDMRASGFEPVSTLSGYRYQDGLHYYESTRDLATHFFIGYLPKGAYVFEYTLRVSQKGDFSNGITTVQCMYAPEFTSHSQGIRVQINK